MGTNGQVRRPAGKMRQARRSGVGGVGGGRRLSYEKIAATLGANADKMLVRGPNSSKAVYINERVQVRCAHQTLYLPAFL